MPLSLSPFITVLKDNAWANILRLTSGFMVACEWVFRSVSLFHLGSLTKEQIDSEAMRAGGRQFPDKGLFFFFLPEPNSLLRPAKVSAYRLLLSVSSVSSSMRRGIFLTWDDSSPRNKTFFLKITNQWHCRATRANHLSTTQNKHANTATHVNRRWCWCNSIIIAMDIMVNCSIDN